VIRLAAPGGLPAGARPATGPSWLSPALTTTVLLRGAYGVALCCAPATLIRLAGGAEAGPPARAVGRLLGARHIVQAAASAAFPAPLVLTLGAETDVLHSASMVALAVLSPPRRRLGLTDSLIAAGFAAAGWVLADCTRAALAAGVSPAPVRTPAREPRRRAQPEASGSGR
jgi:hypothetical protein